METSKIIILRGNSGSGKTTVANTLQKRLGRGNLLISQDVIRREMLWVFDGEGTKTVSLLIDLVKYGKQNCEYVILEGILDAVCYKELFEVIVAEYGSDVYAYYYELSFEETLKRHATKPNCDDFGEDEMKQWWKEKDYIGYIPEKTLLPDMSIEEAVEFILGDLSS